jgi:hypothetical protein
MNQTLSHVSKNTGGGDHRCKRHGTRLDASLEPRPDLEHDPLSRATYTRLCVEGGSLEGSIQHDWLLGSTLLKAITQCRKVCRFSKN